MSSIINKFSETSIIYTMYSLINVTQINRLPYDTLVLGLLVLRKKKWSVDTSKRPSLASEYSTKGTY